MTFRLQRMRGRPVELVTVKDDAALAVYRGVMFPRVRIWLAKAESRAARKDCPT